MKGRIKMDLKEIRNEIDKIDDQLNELFRKRMDTVLQVAKYKAENNIPVLNQGREREIIHRMVSQNGDELASYTKILFNTLFDVSRSYQSVALNKQSDLAEKIKNALSSTPEKLPNTPTVACQGVEGAYSQQMCDKIFTAPSIMYFASFKGVFEAVDKGLCKYGILPVENSIHGSVSEVYDLMHKYKFYIVKEQKLHISHSLLSNGTDIKKIKEIYSHEQAIGQCEEFIRKNGLKAVVCTNTAAAAQKVKESGRDDVAAIASEECAGVYGLNVLAVNIQDSDNNHTRFICISKNLEIYPGANKLSMLVCASHTPGSLYHLISKFSALGINLTKIESRPIPGRDFEFMFCFEMEIMSHTDELIALLSGLDDVTYLGSYSA